MKIILTEEMLKKVIVAEAESSWSKANVDFGKQANTPIPTTTLTRANAQNTAMNILRSMGSSVQGGYQQGNVGNGTYQPVQNIGNWDVNKSINYAMSNSSSVPMHRCAEYVENAIAAGGLPRMSCRENGGNGWADSLHKNGILSSHGFVMVGSGQLQPHGNITGNLQPGDVMVMDTGIPRKVHTAIWTGNQWISDFRQKNANVYSVPAVYWLYRFNGNNKGNKEMV